MQALFQRIWNADSSTSSRLMNAAAVILTVWSMAALWMQRVSPRNAPLPTRRAAPPTPFFPADANVLDFYEGNGAEHDALSSLADIVVVMFYAPWSLHSLEARAVFRQVADTFPRPTNTSAVRFVAVNCHDHRGHCRRSYKLYSYPVIFAYVAGDPVVVFNRALTTNAMLNWISHLKRPYTRILYDGEFTNFVGGSDYAVVGFVAPLAADGYVSRLFNVFHAMAAKSATLTFAVSFAVLQNFQLAERLGLAPNQLRLYANFDGGQRPAEILSSLMLGPSHKSDSLLQWIRDVVASVAWRTVERIGLENDENGGKFLFNKINATDGTLVLFTSDSDVSQSAGFAHLQLKTLAATFRDCTSAEDVVLALSNSMAPAPDILDWRRDLHGLSCRVNRTVGFAVTDRRHADFFIQRWKSWSNFDLYGRLQNNATAAAGDSGHDVESGDLAVFVSNIDEQFFWLTGDDVSIGSISRLVTEFVVERLPPNRPVLVEMKADSTPLSPFTKWNDDSESNQMTGRVASPTASVLLRITVAEFLSDILGRRHDFDAFVFISAGRWNGPSQRVPHILHTVVDYFRPYDRLIKFFILDASENQLPWQYTFEKLPAFVFFPAGRPMESVAFPSTDFPLTVPNLMAFLLAHAQSSLRFQLALGVCGVECLTRNSERLTAFVRRSNEAIRSARRALSHRRHVHPMLNIRLRAQLRRRITERHVARHLLGVVDALLAERRKNGKTSAPPSGDEATLQHLTKDLMLLSWILKSHAANLQ